MFHFISKQSNCTGENEGSQVKVVLLPGFRLFINQYSCFYWRMNDVILYQNHLNNVKPAWKTEKNGESPINMWCQSEENFTNETR